MSLYLRDNIAFAWQLHPLQSTNIELYHSAVLHMHASSSASVLNFKLNYEKWDFLSEERGDAEYFSYVL